MLEKYLSELQVYFKCTSSLLELIQYNKEEVHHQYKTISFRKNCERNRNAQIGDFSCYFSLTNYFKP